MPVSCLYSALGTYTSSSSPLLLHQRAAIISPPALSLFRLYLFRNVRRRRNTAAAAATLEPSSRLESLHHHPHLPQTSNLRASLTGFSCYSLRYCWSARNASSLFSLDHSSDADLFLDSTAFLILISLVIRIKKGVFWILRLNSSKLLHPHATCSWSVAAVLLIAGTFASFPPLRPPVSFLDRVCSCC
jgi:hypothetical protein